MIETNLSAVYHNVRGLRTKTREQECGGVLIAVKKHFKWTFRPE